MATNQGDSGTGDSKVQSAPSKPKVVAASSQNKQSLGEQIKSFQQYLKDVVIEFRKITWPDRKEIAQATLSVLVLVAIITLLVLAFDFILGKAVFGPIDHYVRMHGGLVGR